MFGASATFVAPALVNQHGGVRRYYVALHGVSALSTFPLSLPCLLSVGVVSSVLMGQLELAQQGVYDWTKLYSTAIID